MKTIKVKVLLAHVNKMNQLSTSSPDTRKGWNQLLETVLHLTDTYVGFRYLASGEVPAGQLPGIDRSEDGPPHTFPDDSRREYFAHKSVK